MNRNQFIGLMALLMTANTDGIEDHHNTVGEFADEKARQQGFADWVDAYHNEGSIVDFFDFHAHLQRQADWSRKTFGPDPRTEGVIDHIRKELIEIAAAPKDLSEWIDVAILALDGAWRAGYSPDEIIAALVAKQTKNEGRTWPDWRTMPADRAIEHTRRSE